MRTNKSYEMEAERWQPDIKIEEKIKLQVAQEVGFDPANLEFMTGEQRERTYAALYTAAMQFESVK